jgi:dethiobiotin synthetase
MAQPYFITSSGTGIGKTLLTTSLCWQLRAKGRKVAALKPVISGYEEGDMQTDTAQILLSCGKKPDSREVETISPWRFKAPLSPHMAAELEGKTLSLDELVAFCQKRAAQAEDVLLVEGVGGVMVPLNNHALVLDWMQALGWPVIMVVGSYLGSISHSLTAAQALRSRGIPLAGLVVSESENAGVPLQATVETLENFLALPVAINIIPRLTAIQAPWEQVPPLSGLCGL